MNLLAEKNFDMKSLGMVVGRGGMLKPIPGGTYAVTDALLEDLKVEQDSMHQTLVEFLHVKSRRNRRSIVYR